MNPGGIDEYIEDCNIIMPLFVWLVLLALAFINPVEPFLLPVLVVVGLIVLVAENLVELSPPSLPVVARLLLPVLEDLVELSMPLLPIMVRLPVSVSDNLSEYVAEFVASVIMVVKARLEAGIVRDASLSEGTLPGSGRIVGMSDSAMNFVTSTAPVTMAVSTTPNTPDPLETVVVVIDAVERTAVLQTPSVFRITVAKTTILRPAASVVKRNVPGSCVLWAP